MKDLSNRVDCTAINLAISGLAKSLGIATIAEGVETQEQLDFLKQEGCAKTAWIDTVGKTANSFILR